MHVLLPWMQADLEAWSRRAVAPAAALPPAAGSYHDRYHRIVAVEAPGPPQAQGPFQRVAAAIDRFQIFPARIGRGLHTGNRAGLGETVGLRYHFLPGLDLFFASRVYARLDHDTPEWSSRGFGYRTLLGHPELGQETFAVYKMLATGEVRVEIEAWSRPGMWLTKMILPLARRWQREAGRSALDTLEAVARAGV